MSTVERDLAALARSLSWPEGPDASGVIEERLGARPAPRRRRRVLLVALVAVALLGGLLVAPGTRSAILRFLHVGAVEIERAESLPARPPDSTPAPFGERIAPGEAGGILGESLPAFPGWLGEIAELRARRTPTAQVTAIWRRPAGTVYITWFAATVDRFAGKVVGGEGTRITYVELGPGAYGFWIEGARHLALPAGRSSVEAGRLAGDTLVASDGSGTVRVEGLTRSEAVAVARVLLG